MGFHTGIVKRRDDYYQKDYYKKKGRLLSKGTTEKKTTIKKIKGYRKGKTFTKCAFSLM